MSEAQKSRRSSPGEAERRASPAISTSESDERFFRSLYEFIEHEKETVRCPEEGPDPLRYMIYRSVFSKVIGRATIYKRLLLTIKAGYDDIIGALQRREDQARTAERSLAAWTSHSQSVMSCQRRAAQLRDRVSVLQKETAELQEEIKKQNSWTEQSTWIPGLTVAQSEDPEVLGAHLKHLEAQRAALLDRKRDCVPVEVKAELDAELQASQQHRDQLSIENKRLRVLNKRLRSVSDRLSSWEDGGQQVPLEELLGSTLENVRQASVMDDDTELFQEEEPTGVDQSKLLRDDLDRFMELIETAQYEDAAVLAARSPAGVLRSLHVMETFEGVKGHPGCVPPVLLFFQALLMTVPTGVPLSADLSVLAVRYALQHGATQLVTHAVVHNKLTCCPELGDTLTEHAQKNPAVADMCLALATVTYEACGLDRKTALSMCRRGLIRSAAEFMKHSESLTAEDCMWVLCRSPSLSLLQLLTEPQRGQAAILSAGGACSVLLADPEDRDLALQLLDGFVSRGGALEDVILEDSGSSVDVWTHVASLCSELNRADLSQAILSVLLDQSGTGVLSPDLEGAQLMEHVFL